MALRSVAAAISESNLNLDSVLPEDVVTKLIKYFADLQMIRMCDMRVGFCAEQLDKDLDEIADDIDDTRKVLIVLILAVHFPPLFFTFLYFLYVFASYTHLFFCSFDSCQVHHVASDLLSSMCPDVVTSYDMPSGWFVLVRLLPTNGKTALAS